MSVDPTIDVDITLLDKTQLNRTVISVAGDATTGNLKRHRKQGSYTFAGVRKNRHGSITLRAKDGLFITKEPIMTRDIDFPKYLIEVQFFQPSKSGDTGHPDPRGRVGELVRYELSEPIQEADQKGQLLTITLTAIENRLRQSLDSESNRLVTHKTTFIRRLDHYGLTRGVGAPSITQTPSEIELPDGKVRLDWIPGTTKFTHDLLVENIDSLREVAVVAGDFDDFYYYFVNSATITNNVAVKAEIFGTRDATDRGEQEVILKPIRTASTDTYEKKHTVITANTNIRNVFIVRGQNGAHSFPMEFARFASDWEHAKISDDWVSLQAYLKGDYVQHDVGSSTVRLYKCILDVTSATEPQNDATHWDSLSTFNKHSPLTNDIDLWVANLDAKSEPAVAYVPGVSGGIDGDGHARGFAVDMNICMTHYDVSASQNPYLAVSGKDVEGVGINDPASINAAEIVHGFRVALGPATIGAFAGNNNTIAEWNEFQEPSAGWEFSDTAVNDDFVHDRSFGEVIRNNGTIWVVSPPAWKLSTNFQNSSPFHPCQDITLTTGPDGRANSAIEWKYNWDDGTTGFGDDRNKASRWAGFNLKLPMPHRAQGSLAVGDIWKNATLDFENLSLNPDGTVSDWNKGIGSENLGNLRGVACKLELDFRDVDEDRIDGLANLNTVWWFRDSFNRTVYTRAKVRRTSNFVNIQFDAGPNAEMQLHENRVEELFSLSLGDFTYVFPFNDHLLEKEYTGIRFNWNFVKEMGMFYEDSYDENFFYKNAQNAVFDRITEAIEEAFSTLTAFLTGKRGNFKIHHCHVRLAEFRWIKDPYVSSEDGVTADARVSKAVASDQFDYITLKDIAKGKVIRTEHYPQFTPVDSYVDVRMRLGEKFKASGTRWSDEKDPPGNIRTMVCAEYTIFESDNGSRMQALGYTRFGQF